MGKATLVSDKRLRTWIIGASRCWYVWGCAAGNCSCVPVIKQRHQTIPNIKSDIKYIIWTTKMANTIASSVPIQNWRAFHQLQAFTEHVVRAHYQVMVWSCAMFPDPPDIDPVGYGWTWEVNKLRPVSLPDDASPVPVEVFANDQVWLLICWSMFLG